MGRVEDHGIGTEDQDFESLPLRDRRFLERFEARMAQLSWSSFGEEALRYRINLDRGRIRMRTGILEDDSERKEQHVVEREREKDYE